MSQYRLRVGRSRIHRFGVFALEDIPCGGKVIEYTGRLLSPHQARRLSLRRRTYLAYLNLSWRIDPSIGGSGAEFVNHGCDPNLRVQRSRGHLYFFTRRRIRACEELTADYRYRANSRKVPCRCGSPKCRGNINLTRTRRHAR